MLIYSVFAMVAILLISSLAVDLGRVQLAKTEMECAVDSAARAAVFYLPSDPSGARSAAISMAAAHTVDGKPLVLLSTDVLIGKWSTATKTLDTTSVVPDAVQVTGNRTAARGTPIAMTLAKASGFTDFSLSFTGVAVGTPDAGVYGIVGLNGLSFAGTSTTGTFNSVGGSSSTGSASTDGDVASNGTITLGGSASIGGTVYYNTPSAPSGGTYFEAKTKLPSPIPTPATPGAGPYLSSNSNPSIGQPTSGATINYSSSGTTTVAGGNYVFNGVTISGGATFQFSGPTTVWMYGDMNLSNAHFRAYQNKPTNLQVKFCSAATLTMSSGADVYGVITGPTSTFNLGSGTSIVGSAIAGTLSLNGASVYYDVQLGPNGVTSSSGSTVVK